MINFLLWIVYFAQSCLAACTNYMNQEGNFCESINETITRGQFCVCDPDDRSERCCAFDRTSRASTPFFCFGYTNDKENMTERKYAASRIAIIFKTVLFIYAIFFGIIGIWCITSPESVVFNHVVVDEFRQQLGLQTEQVHNEEKVHKDTVMNMLQSSLTGLSSLFENSNEISKADLAKIRDQLSQVENNLIYTKPEAVSVTEPTSLEGGSMLFYALFCVYQLMMDNFTLVNTANIYIHWIWFGCKIIAIIAAASGHGRGLENSGFVTALIVFYAGGLVVYGFIERWIHSFNNQHGSTFKLNISDQSDDEDIGTFK